MRNLNFADSIDEKFNDFGDILGISISFVEEPNKVEFIKGDPNAIGAKDSVTVEGKLTDEGYALCWVSKVGSPRLLSSATTRILANATNATNTTPASTAPVQSTADWEAKQNF